MPRKSGWTRKRIKGEQLPLFKYTEMHLAQYHTPKRVAEMGREITIKARKVRDFIETLKPQQGVRKGSLTQRQKNDNLRFFGKRLEAIKILLEAGITMKNVIEVENDINKIIRELEERIEKLQHLKPQ